MRNSSPPPPAHHAPRTTHHASPLDLTFATGLAVERDVPLGPYTSLKVGGPASLFVRARGARELARCLAAAYECGVPWLLIGGGSNVLVADRGFGGLAIKVEAAPGRRTRGDVLEETAEAVRLRCDAGVLSAGFARWTASLGWTGFEWACGVPGTIGGAAAGIAGAYGGDMASVVERVLAWSPEGESSSSSRDGTPISAMNTGLPSASIRSSISTVSVRSLYGR
jgi:UDP-N-acetylenolpyruvoylglucosamine reductase